MMQYPHGPKYSEEILEKHPEILEDVKRESQRMMNERDKLLEQLHAQQGTSGEDSIVQTQKQNTNTTATIDEENDNDVSDDGEKQSATIVQPSELILADLKQVKSALRSFALVAKDMGMTTYDMARRYLMAFTNKIGVPGNEDENPSDENNDFSQNDQQNNDTATINMDEDMEAIADASDSTTQPSLNIENELKFDLKEITIEVIEQIKSDITKVVKIIVPKRTQEQWKQTIVPKARELWMKFINTSDGDGESAAGDEKVLDEND